MLIDLSHEVTDETVTYPGLPPMDTSKPFLKREDSVAHYTGGCSFEISRASIVGNTGTYIDSPFHRFAGSDVVDIGQLPLQKVANVPGVLVDARGCRQISRKELEPLSGQFKGAAVIILTAWSKHWGTETYRTGEHPFVTEDGAQLLVDAGATIVGIDSLNIDDTNDGKRPAHSKLLQRGIPVVEHLTNVTELVGHHFRFFAVPPKLRNMGTFSVRAFAITDTSPTSPIEAL